MKTTAVIALAAMTLAVAGCTTSDPTPPGSLGALSEAEEGDEAQGIPSEEEQEEEGTAGEASEEEGGGEDTADQTEPESEGEAAGNGEEGGASGELPPPAQMSDEVCIAFFDGAAPLAGSAQDNLLLVERGSANNLTALEYQEIDVLAQRLDELGALGTDEQAEIIETINAPFTAVQRAGSAEGGQDADSGEVAYDSIDTGGSEQAQEEFAEACLAES